MKKILILFGGPSSEHLISCKSAKSIIEHIDDDKYEVDICGISEDNIWYQFDDLLDMLETGNWLVSTQKKRIENIIEFIKKYDIVFPIIHGSLGEDGKIVALLDMFGVKYIGSGVLSHALGYDKYFTKQICKNIGVKQVDYVLIKKNENKHLKKIENSMNYPLIVKPCCCGSSIGITVVNNKKELSKGVKDAFKYDDKVIIEKYIKNRREFECGVLEDKKIVTSSIGEIVTNSKIYDYDSKYINKSKVIIPAFISNELSDTIKKQSLDIFNILNCKGLARIDFIYDNDNDILYFNEINTMPGFTDISMYAKGFINDGISYKELINKLIDSV